MIEFNCPACHQRYEAESDLIGTPTTCPSCNEGFTVPNPDGYPASPGPKKFKIQKNPAPRSTSTPSPYQSPSVTEVTITDIDIPFTQVFSIVCKVFFSTLLLCILVAIVGFLLSFLGTGLGLRANQMSPP
jgi:hypothetical protein